MGIDRLRDAALAECKPSDEASKGVETHLEPLRNQPHPRGALTLNLHLVANGAQNLFNSFIYAHGVVLRPVAIAE